MDAMTLLVAALIAKSVPGTAGAAATAAAAAAEASAELAQQHSMGVAVSGTGIVFTDLTEEEQTDG